MIEAGLCRQRLERAAPQAHQALSLEWDDWLAFAERERLRQIERFRGGPPPAASSNPRWVRPQLQRDGRRSVC